MSLKNPLNNSAAATNKTLAAGAIGVGAFFLLMARYYPQQNRFKTIFEESDEYFRQEHPKKFKRSEKD